MSFIKLLVCFRAVPFWLLPLLLSESPFPLPITSLLFVCVIPVKTGIQKSLQSKTTGYRLAPVWQQKIIRNMDRLYAVAFFMSGQIIQADFFIALYLDNARVMHRNYHWAIPQPPQGRLDFSSHPFILIFLLVEVSNLLGHGIPRYVIMTIVYVVYLSKKYIPALNQFL